MTFLLNIFTFVESTHSDEHVGMSKSRIRLLEVEKTHYKSQRLKLFIIFFLPDVNPFLMEPLLLFPFEGKIDVLPICLFEGNFHQAKIFRFDGRQGEWSHSFRFDVLPGRQTSSNGATLTVLTFCRLDGRENGKNLPDGVAPFEKYSYCATSAQIH